MASNCKLIALLVGAMVLLGCEKQAQEATPQGSYKVEKLFTHEGCTVYRFNDGVTVYYTNCQGQTQTSHNCGKNCTRTDRVNTNTDKEQP